MATDTIIVGIGDAERGYYTITPGGHFDPYGPNFAIPVNGVNEMTFVITPDDGYVIGDIMVTGIIPGYYSSGFGYLVNSTYTFTGLQDPDAPLQQGIFAYAVPYPITPATEKPFPWWWLVVAGAAGAMVGAAIKEKERSRG
ncbi:MAG: hypothetical protein PHI12_08190 [Dehalococcoidales bacterium]|nr:hypothetical protein [Dehalococcoidales bacterium]